MIMMIDIFDGIEINRGVPIAEAFPDEGDRTWARETLVRNGPTFVGGGASPLFYISETDEN
ncbi:MAG: hypothetical protein WDM91_10790 [Rhizomicrobium sp.]